jgi:hypothetical protein
MIMLNLPNSATTANTLASTTIGIAEATLATLLADARAELDRLDSITKRAGYTIFFRDPSGAIINHTGNALGVSKPLARGGLAPSLLRRVCKYVEANLEAKIELADLAALANLSRRHFAYASSNRSAARLTAMSYRAGWRKRASFSPKERSRSAK